jgi:hypothetical protein
MLLTNGFSSLVDKGVVASRARRDRLRNWSGELLRNTSNHMQWLQAHIALSHYDAAVRLTENAIANHDLLFATMLSAPLLHKPMQDQRLRQMLSEVGEFLCHPNGVRTG